MERLQRHIQVDPIPENDPYITPMGLKKSNSQASTSSKGSLTTSGVSIIEKNEISSDKEKNGNPPRSASEGNMSNNNCDEGLGESFDQQSEMSDSNQSIKATNGIGGMDTVPEEGILIDTVESSPSSDELTQPSSSPGSELSLELTLDPSKLGTPDRDECSSFGSSQQNLNENDDNPFDKKAQPIKKVSFYAGGDCEGTEGSEAVSDTYVYEGRPKKFSAVLKQMGLKKD